MRSAHAELSEVLPLARSLANELVRLAEVPAPQILAAADRIQRVLAQHAERTDPFLRAIEGHRLAGRVPPELLLREHRIFPASVQQLRGFLNVVLRDDHPGGTRPALGQFWTLLCESLHLHLEDEAAYLVAAGAAPPPRAADRVADAPGLRPAPRPSRRASALATDR